MLTASFIGVQTCRSLKALVSEKSVWITILTSICQEQALFKPSYPVQDMDVAQLQRAAMGPTLFQRRLTKGAIPADKLNEAKELEPASIVELDGLLEAAGPNSTAPSIDARRWNVHRRLIPGGRFLAHVKHLKPQRSGLDSQMEESDELKSFLVEIWDLGVAGSAPLSNPILLANKRFTRGASQHVISVVAFYTEEAPESLRLLIALGGDDFVMKVFSISGLGEGNPSIQEAAALRVDTNPVTESLHDGEEPIFRGDLVLTRLDDTIIILWNFSRGLYTILRIDDDGYVARRYAFYDNVSITHTTFKLPVILTGDYTFSG
ncbi:hypothetical protein DFP72DRAFT_447638 [Ephemerocybe angulata]|uniref:Uncharacterized protein n=1 Tax=Ephemerocybe angulata TaxID=980116 RepID=A0A8H6HVM4_9AGAR|nr:hypothetical protein DFP72DRAFT_447638 [Tulosesus angulatus]